MTVLSMHSSEHSSDSDAVTLVRSAPISTATSRDDLEQEAREYINRSGEIDIPFVESDSDDN